MFRKKLIAAWFLLVGLPLLALLAVLKAGAGLSAPAAASIRTGASPSTLPAALNLFLLVLQVAVILLASRGVGLLFKRIKQPQVIGEMVAGILLGPSLLGWAAVGLERFVLSGKPGISERAEPDRACILHVSGGHRD